MATILGANTLSDDYQVANSVRFNPGDSAYMHKTPTAGNRRTATFSCWIKRSLISSAQTVFWAGSDNSNYQAVVRLLANDKIVVAEINGGSTTWEIITDRILVDAAAWYHIVVAMDTTQGTAANRVKIYVNGVQETSFGAANYPNEDATDKINSAIRHDISGRNHASTSDLYLNAYLAEVVFIDGQQLAPTSFGEFDSDSGIWVPIEVSDLTFGNNGFYLDFEASGNLGNDANGGTDLTEVNLAATDQSTDTCTNNFCTLNPLDPTADITLSEGNLKAVYGTSGTRDVQVSTFGVSSGKWYWEIKVGGAESPNNATLGITQNSSDNAVVLGGNTNNSWEYRGYDGKVYHNAGDEGGSLDTFTENDIIGVAINLDTLQSGLHKLYFSKNGTFQNGADPEDFTSTTGVYGIDDNVDYFPAISDAGSSATPSFEMNFGSPSHSVSSGNADANGHGNFEYAPPAGFFALCTKNLAEFG